MRIFLRKCFASKIAWLTFIRRGLLVFVVLTPSLLLPVEMVWATETTGVAHFVIDGDSLIIRRGSERYEARLWGIDCPEYDQPLAREAKRWTWKMVKGHTLTILVKDRDRYGRKIVIVYAGEKCLNAELVRAGFAWVYERYCRAPVCSDWKKLEQEARKDRRGVWQQPRPVSPWRWRWEDR